MTQDNSASFTARGMPTHQQLVRPVLQAVSDLGGSAKSREIIDHVVENYPDVERLLEMVYPKNPENTVFLHRTAFGRSLAKRIGALDQPSRGMYLLTQLGKELLDLPEHQALERVHNLQREEDRKRRQNKVGDTRHLQGPDEYTDETDSQVLEESDADENDPGTEWKSRLLKRLHQLSPDGFEKFGLYLVRRYGLELTHVGGSADEGIDGIGTAPLSPVLSSRVAVQVKRYEPAGKPIGRETVALFQRDAQTKGAERAILVTLSRFTGPAKNAATSSTPTVDLISGDRLAELIRDDGDSGVSLQPTVNEKWFDQFD
ncbi:MAG: restriction endonuclease [Yaniella sp.]|nr:restriction endonuclease [Yaniella sp.]